MTRSIAITMTLLLLAGCAIGPDYRRPEIVSPPVWQVDMQQAQDTANTAWWEQFNDPVLNELIGTALRENYDLLVATARVEEFYGLYGATRADLFPQIGYDGSAGRVQATTKGPIPITPGTSSKYSTYQAEFSASWEIDLWGKIRRATEAARADLMAAEDSRRGVILSLVTSVATAYIDLRSLDQQLVIAQQTAKSREESVKLFELRFKGGNISEMELSQVRSEYYVALAAIPDLERRIRQQENFLSILLGKNPGPIVRGKKLDAIALPAVPAGLPSDLLARRPDIRQAEQALIAANARIGVAKAQYFPSISLTGFFGSASIELSDLFTGPAKTWSYAGALAGPIFTAGKIKGTVRAAQAVQQEALFGYEQAIRNAFSDFEDALIDQDRTRVQLDAQAKQVEALATYARLARLRYENGYTSYIEVLDAERSLFNGQLSYAQTQDALLRALVNLYKSMGGGWVMEADKIAVSTDRQSAPAAPRASQQSK
ncbi:MAG TPA: efflux transporter outer membrane subunit [Nitrospirota bacterium]|nr:efflux transporter outer membrane subunit [Nitrospirota bacterium]